MAPRSTQPPPAPLTLQNKKSKSSLRSFFSSGRTSPVTPPATPGNLSPESGTISPNPKSPKIISYSYSSFVKPAIPQHVFVRIAKELRVLHGIGSTGVPCDTCFMRDLCSLALVSKRFSKGALTLLYSKIRLHGPDSENTKFHFGGSKKQGVKYGARINSLCRTLRSRPDLAELVIELKLPAYDLTLPGPDIANIHSMAAAVVMCCPNLERLVGFYPNFEFGMGLELPGNPKEEEWRRGSDRLWQALSTRKRLKEHVWLLVGDEQFDPGPDDIGFVDEHGVFRQEAEPLPHNYIHRFLTYHVQWQNLETLVLHGMNTISSLLPRDFMALFQYVPNLKSAYISHFAYYQFTSDCLWALPKSLKALRLECLTGLTDRGLATYFSSAGNPLEKLSLINLDIRSLLLIIKIFANLYSLEKFTLLQDSSPTIDETDTLFLRPLLACHSLKFLHWDCLNPGTAETHLASSILEGGFPKLQYLRAPCDSKGTLQAVCRPREKIELPGDKFRSLIVRQTPKSKQGANGYAPSTPDRHSTSSRPSTSSAAGTNGGRPSSTRSIDAEELTRHLPSARSKAQKRLELALNPPSAPAPTISITNGITTAGGRPNTSSGYNPRPKTPKDSYSSFDSYSSSNSSSLLGTSLLPANTFYIHIVVTNVDFDSPTPASNAKIKKGGGNNVVSNGVKEIVSYHGYLGTITSRVEYHLLPDVPGSESALAGLGDIMEAGWEWRDLNATPGTPGGVGVTSSGSGNGAGGLGGGSSDGCTGLVNVRNAVSNGGNGRAMARYWGHRERWGWRMIPLAILF